jgi:DUF1365 family protein
MIMNYYEINKNYEYSNTYKIPKDIKLEETVLFKESKDTLYILEIWDIDLDYAIEIDKEELMWLINFFQGGE